MDEPTNRPSPSLAERLRARIAERGPMTFAEFMRAALYDPAEGFYTRPGGSPPVGESGGFVTSPHLSPVFGRLLARQVEEFWELLERPDPFHVLEAGAGDGVLAGQIVDTLPEAMGPAVRYTAIEPSPRARWLIERRLDGSKVPLTLVADLSDVPPVDAGCLIANELLDNLPFHLLRGGPEGPVERRVDWGAEGFVLVDGPLSSPELAGLAPRLGPGGEAAVSPAVLAFLERLAAVLRRGYAWIADYGQPSGAAPEVHGYRAHRVEVDVLSDPGSRDITGGVDFGSLIRRSRELGLRAWGPVTQREALLSLGFRALDEEARRGQAEATDARRGIEAIRIYSERNRAGLLLSPSGLGAFLVLCLGIRTDRRPRSVLGEAGPS